MKVSIHTLGCKLNFVESERISKACAKMGISLDDQDPDFVIVNGCTVTANADRKSKIFAQKGIKSSRLILTGCAVRAYRKEWEKIFPSAVFCDSFSDVIDFLASVKKDFFSPETSPPLSRTRKFIEIQNGCDTYCSYCAIPFGRGPHRSRNEKEILDEIKQAEQDGFCEIVLTGVHIASWGSSHTRKVQESLFSELLNKILVQTKIPRIRLSSLYPHFLGKDFFAVFADSRICDHLHLSLQSGSNKILEQMNRGHSHEDSLRAIESAKSVRKTVGISADILVGFPGETDQDFEDTVHLCQDPHFIHLHVFPFSSRPGTKASFLEKVPSNIVRERSSFLRTLDKTVRKNFYERFLGQTFPVLWEQDSTGLAPNFLRVQKKGAIPNTIEDITLHPKNIVLSKQEF